jgi:hypothetical protein
VLLAVLSRGDVLVLAPLLAITAWRPQALAALLPALLASGWRWGSTSLEAVAGAQAVLGPAGFVGSFPDAASAWLAAIAIVLVAPEVRPAQADAARSSRSAAEPQARRAWSSPPATRAARAAQLLVAAAAGTAAAAVVAGPAPGGALWARVVGALLATVAALAVASARRGARCVHDRPIGTVLDVGAVLAGVIALLLAAVGAPPWSGTLDTGAVAAGMVLSLAMAALVGALLAAVPALRDERLHHRARVAGTRPPPA